MNLLEEEPLIIARLKDKVTGVKLVGDPEQKAIASVASILGTVNLAPLLPALFVQPDDADVASDSSDGLAVQEDRRWLVFVTLGHVPDPAGLAKTYEDAGNLMGEVVKALTGWTPGPAGMPAAPGFRPMHFMGRLAPAIEPGHIEFPLRFSVRRGYTVPAA